MKPESKMGKKPYCQPRLRKLEVAPDEVLVTGCKTNAAGLGTGKAGNFSCQVPAPPCSALGS